MQRRAVHHIEHTQNLTVFLYQYANAVHKPFPLFGAHTQEPGPHALRGPFAPQMRFVLPFCSE